jgi:hypothetical protein
VRLKPPFTTAGPLRPLPPPPPRGNNILLSFKSPPLHQGYCFCEFEDDACVEAAIAGLHMKNLNRKMLTVKVRSSARSLLLFDF